MAGDWIKFEHATASKPEILLAAELLGLSRREALGLFLDYWLWLDSNLQDGRNGFVTHASRKSIEEALHCPGFAAVLERIKWAQFDDEERTLYVVNWQRHNGATAKSRASNQKRQQRFRNAHVTVAPLPEKRREEKSSNGLSVLSEPQVRQRATRLPTDWQLPDDLRDWAVKCYGMEPQRAVRMSLAFRDYWAAKSGANATKHDWAATWRNWVRKEMADA